MVSDLETLTRIIASKYGFKINKKRLKLLHHIIRERSQVDHFGDDKKYLQWINNNEKHPEWQVLIDQLTIKETYFFRNKHQFKFLENHIIPHLIRKYVQSNWVGDGLASPEIRVLSAGCSTGEEPYSIGISFADKVQYFRGWNIRIHAFDVSHAAIEQARGGCFLASTRMKQSLNEMNPGYMNKYFECRDAYYCVKNEIKKLIRFRKSNLKAMCDLPSSFLPKYDVIFCRNVMIYFGYQDQAALVRLLESLLKPGGYLMMGDAETLNLYTHGLLYVDSDAGLIYQKYQEH